MGCLHLKIVNKSALAEMQHSLALGGLAPVWTAIDHSWGLGSMLLRRPVLKLSQPVEARHHVVSSSAQADYEMARRSLNKNAPVNIVDGAR